MWYQDSSEKREGDAQVHERCPGQEDREGEQKANVDELGLVLTCSEHPILV